MTPRSPSPVVQRHWDNLDDDITIPTLVLLGALETETIPGYCTALVNRLRKKGQPIGYTLFPDATHGFDMSNMSRNGRVRAGVTCTGTVQPSPQAAWRGVKAMFDRELMGIK